MKHKKEHKCNLYSCNTNMQEHYQKEKPCCYHKKSKIDFLLYFSITTVILGYCSYIILGKNVVEIHFYIFGKTVFQTINRMWIGIAAGIFFAGLLSKIPQDFIILIFGSRKGGIGGILKASVAGVLLDLCSHGILIVAMQLYKRGLTLGQVMAFLIASPWNSLSLTFILWALVGLKWTSLFIFFSLMIAVTSGVIFDSLVKREKLPKNPNRLQLEDKFSFWEEFRYHIKTFKPNFNFFKEVLVRGVKDSKMVLKWVCMGVIIAALMRSFISVENFKILFGPTVMGLLSTIVVATIIEVCSEGSIPVAAEILTRAKAPGNSFAFLMVGVSTDYTEIMSLKETTKSWKIALFLPLITLPQVVVISSLMEFI